MSVFVILLVLCCCNSIYGRFAPRRFAPCLDVSPPGRFAPCTWTFRPLNFRSCVFRPVNVDVQMDVLTLSPWPWPQWSSPKIKHLTSEAEAKARGLSVHCGKNESSSIDECNILYVRHMHFVCLGQNIASSKYQLWFIRYKSVDSIKIISILLVKNKTTSVSVRHVSREKSPPENANSPGSLLQVAIS